MAYKYKYSPEKIHCICLIMQSINYAWSNYIPEPWGLDGNQTDEFLQQSLPPPSSCPFINTTGQPFVCANISLAVCLFAKPWKLAVFGLLLFFWAGGGLICFKRRQCLVTQSIQISIWAEETDCTDKQMSKVEEAGLGTKLVVTEEVRREINHWICRGLDWLEFREREEKLNWGKGWRKERREGGRKAGRGLIRVDGGREQESVG